MVPRFCTERLQSLVRTLELTGLDEYHALQKVASFATLVATYEKGRVAVDYCVVLHPNHPPTSHPQPCIGFLLILEPYETDNATVPNPIFHLVYVDLGCVESASLMFSYFFQGAWTHHSQ